MLSILDLKKRYLISKNVYIDAINGISLEVKKGEFVAIVGPSGSGKTTFLNLVGCVDRPTEGKIIIDGIEVSSISENERTKIRRTKIGYIFQFFNLISTLTAYENTELPLWSLDSEAKKKGIERIKYLFEELGIYDLRKRFPRELSGGQRQRVAVIRALANSPELVLADEPTGNLDSENALSLIELLRRENKEFGTTFIVATHNLDLLQYFDKIIYLKDGKVSRIIEQTKKEV